MFLATIVPKVLAQLAHDTLVHVHVTQCSDDDACAAVAENRVRPRVLSLVWHAERELAPTLERFCDATIAACRELQRELDERLAGPLALAGTA